MKFTKSLPGGGNRKGFTLIELISVIIIMGVIALITIPIIKDIINSSREKNFKNSALGLIEAANEYYLNSKLTNDSFEEITFKVNNGKMVSEDRELVFNGKVPVGDSYVKIKSNGDIAINITDGEYFAVKDYDEVGVSTGMSEDNALLREELAKKITELESKLESTTKELEDKIESNTSDIESNTDKINTNTTSISSNKEELNSKINSTKEELNNKINSNKEELTSKITTNTTNINSKLPLTGGTITGSLNVNNKINNIYLRSIGHFDVTSDTLDSFRTTMNKGLYNESMNYLTLFRATNYDYLLQHSAALAFGLDDVSGFINVDYSASGGSAYIGGGNKDKINWIKQVAFDGDVYTVSSDERLKYDIEDITDELINVYMEIQPILFKYKNDTDKKIYTGVIAQQVIDVFNKYNLDYQDYGIVKLMPKDVDGNIYYSINYENLDTLTMLITQKQQKKITEIENRLDKIEQYLK